MISEAAAVIIGSGALGSSVAYHLSKAGVSPVALVDKHAIASQTSPRAAGLTAQVRHTELMTRLAKRATDKIRSFAADTGEPMVFHPSGSLRIARTAQNEEQLRAEVARAQRLGVEVDLVSPDEARQLMPFLTTGGIRAVSFTKGDLYLEPGQLPRGYANATAKLGGILLPDTEVTGIGVTRGRVTKVHTSKGDIHTPVVVDAAGAWTRLVARLATATVGAVATRHQLLITQPVAGVEANQPITRVIDANFYIRPEDGGFLLGGYEPDPLQFDMANAPAGFGIDDLPLDIAVLRRLIDRVADQFPILRDIEVKEHRGGLPTMTADGEHIVGPVPDLRGFYVAGGCCVGGLAIAPVVGELLAEWITSGQPPMDLSPLLPSRPAVKIDEARLYGDCLRQYAFHYSKPAQAD